MDSFITVDPDNTDRSMMWKEVETCVADPGEVSVEFWAISPQIVNLAEYVGFKKPLTVNERDTDGEETGKVLISYQAILTKFEIDASVGQYVRGSVSFRLTGYREE